jgi:hypothetical protein
VVFDCNYRQLLVMRSVFKPQEAAGLYALPLEKWWERNNGGILGELAAFLD